MGNTSFLGYPMVLAFFNDAVLVYAIFFDQLGGFLILSTYGSIIVAFYSPQSNKLGKHGSSSKISAMSMLKARLYEHEMQKRRSDQQAVEDEKSDIGWGSQIRSYVLDQSRIKDLRTSVETGNTQAVLDGDLNQFIEASLKQGL